MAIRTRQSGKNLTKPFTVRFPEDVYESLAELTDNRLTAAAVTHLVGSALIAESGGRYSLYIPVETSSASADR